MLAASVALLSCVKASAQDTGYDVFNPISKYLALGDADKLSAWSFFRSYTPRSFEITHRAGRSNMKYALGTLNAGGEMFVVTIFVGYNEQTYKIQHLKIERLN